MRPSRQIQLTWLTHYILEEVYMKSKFRFKTTLLEDALVEWAINNDFQEEIKKAMENNNKRIAEEKLKV